MVLHNRLPHLPRRLHHRRHRPERQHPCGCRGPHWHRRGVPDLVLLGHVRISPNEMAVSLELLRLHGDDSHEPAGGEDSVYVPEDAVEMAWELYFYGWGQRFECAVLVSIPSLSTGS